MVLEKRLLQGVSIEAGRLMLRRIRELATRGETFAFETTMASRSFLPFLTECRGKGFEIHLIYIWLCSPDLAVARVSERVESGGHSVDEKTIRSRYIRGVRNFFILYAPIADGWTLYDNSGEDPLLIAEKIQNREVEIRSDEIWLHIQEALNEHAR